MRGCGWSISLYSPIPSLRHTDASVFFLCCLDRKSKGEKIFTPPPISVCLDSISSHSRQRFFHLDLLLRRPASAPRIPGRNTQHMPTSAIARHATVCTQLFLQLSTTSTPYRPPTTTTKGLYLTRAKPCPDSSLAQCTSIQPLHLRNPASRMPLPQRQQGQHRAHIQTSSEHTEAGINNAISPHPDRFNPGSGNHIVLDVLKGAMLQDPEPATLNLPACLATCATASQSRTLSSSLPCTSPFHPPSRNPHPHSEKTRRKAPPSSPTISPPRSNHTPGLTCADTKVPQVPLFSSQV
jgi:hypothetical protein